MSPRRKRFDELDYRIIQHLHAEARASASDIARRTGANERTVRKRIQHLMAARAIRLTAVLDPEAFGYLTVADIFLDVDPERQASVLDRLMAMPELTYVALGQETTAVSIEARFKDYDALREFLRSTLPAIPGVKVTRYTLVPRILRNIDEWMPPKRDFSVIPVTHSRGRGRQG